MKLPHFAFYPSDFYMKTMNLSDAQVGRYMRLLCNQWINGPLDSVPVDLQEYFELTEKGYVNMRLEEERVKASSKHKQTSEAAKKRWQERTHKRTNKQPEPEPEPELKQESDNNKSAPKVATSLEDRKDSFRKKVFSYRDKYENDMLEDFCTYWSEHNEGGRKMLFEMKKTFNIGLRLSNWKKKSLEFGVKSEKGVKFPDGWDPEFVKKHCQDQKTWNDYQRHLKSLGLVKKSGPGGLSYGKP